MDNLIYLTPVTKDVSLYRDKSTHDIVIAIRTDIGTVTTSITAQEACALGVELIRESGKRYVYRGGEQNESADISTMHNDQLDHGGRNGERRRAIPVPGEHEGWIHPEARRSDETSDKEPPDNPRDRYRSG